MSAAIFNNNMNATGSQPLYNTGNAGYTSSNIQHQTMNSSTVSGMDQGQVYMVSEAALYHPVGCEYVAPGRNLRAGMSPLYNISSVRTFEAPPMFNASRGVVDSESSSSSSSTSGRKGVVVAKKPVNNKKKFLCC